MTTQERKYIYKHVNQETAYEVDDYPWGFRLRTKIRYWIESKEKLGQRFCSQTINPKTGAWCKPKYSTYFPVVVLFLDEKGYIDYDFLGYGKSIEEINAFKNVHLVNLDDFQKNQLKHLIAMQTIMDRVKFKFKQVESMEEAEKLQEQNKKVIDNINKHIYIEKQKTVL